VSLAKKLIFRLIECREAMANASRYIDRDLSPWDRLKLRLHISQCWCCARFVQQLPLLGQFCRQLEDCEDHFPHETLSDEARDHLNKTLSENKNR
jgi:hypothetical protein